MDNAKQHWPILRRLGPSLEKKVREFLVIGWKGDGVIVATEDGLSYWFGEMWFKEGEVKTTTKPTPLDVPELISMEQGDVHILLLTKQGKIYSMGKNDYGQLGLGTIDHEIYFSPQLIFSQQKFISVRCGRWYSLALTEDGKIWSWGSNEYGQVGMDSSSEYFLSPRKISKLDHRRVVAVECGGGHSLALTDQGEVYSWGCNGSGQLGDGNDRLMGWSSKHTPTRITTISPVRSMAAGTNHTLLLTQTGEVYACGWNERGQLGLPDFTEFCPRLSKVAGLPPILQIASSGPMSIAMSHDHRCFIWGELINWTCYFTPRKLPLLYSTVESPIAFFAPTRNTPHSVSVPG